jgi:hypothetical protein
MYPNTICTPMPKGKYQCLCPKTGFDIKPIGTLGTDSDGKQLLIEECKDIDECAQGKCSSKDKGIYKLHTETKQTLFIENNS